MKKIRVWVFIVILTTFSVVCISLAADYKYVGSSKSDKYHHPSCQWAQKINPSNLVTFKTAKEAKEAGYVPCKVCKPPTKD
ncbi:MAG: Ada metal-binding domain-containing protein [Pseudomonadota bacterium]